MTPLCSHVPSKEERLRSLWPLFAILALGFFMRLYTCSNTYIVNPDGPLYIHQARAIYFNQLNQLTSCGLTYLSPYPFFIAGAYTLLSDWVASARAVSLLFGTMTLLPLYLLLRRFTERRISLICLLIFALNPTLVDASADVIKEPVSWPLMGFGLYFFIRNLDEDGNPYLTFSSICFLAAATARIEAILFLVVSVAFILLLAKRNRIVKLLYFLAPVALFILLAAITLKGSESSVGSTFRFGEVLDKPSAVLAGYKTLRQNLSGLIQQPVMGSLELFLERARNLVWFIALGTLASYVIQTFFYPFFLPFLLGLPGIAQKTRNDLRIAYLVFLSLSALALLYFHILHTWVIALRFVVIFMFPSFICMAYGIDRLLAFFTLRWRLTRRSAVALVCLAVLAFGLSKDLGSRERDKVVFRQMGELIARHEGKACVIHVASSLHLLRWLSFYANLNYPGAPCPQPYSDFDALVGTDYAGFVQNLKRENVTYFVWEEKRWPPKTFNFEKEVGPDHFEALGSWNHPDSGRIVLYRVT